MSRAKLKVLKLIIKPTKIKKPDTIITAGIAD